MRPPRPPKTVVDYDYILTSPKFHTEGIGSEVLKKYLQEHGEDIYHITIEGKEYQIKVKYLINFITIDNKFYEFFYNGHSPQIPLEYFKYAVLMFFQEKNADLDLENNEMIQQRLKQIENDEELQLINKYNKPNDPNLSKIRVNPKLREAILKDMPNYHGLKLLEAIYIYVKLCKLLTYDDEFFATNQKGESAKVHEEIARISQITPENNKVVCYEFASIYEAMLNEFGIPCEISKSDIDTYGGEHTAIVFKIDGHLIVADSTTSVLAGDLFAAKINLYPIGFQCVNGHNIKGFDKAIEKVFNDISSKEPDYIPKPKSFKDLLEEYKHVSDDIPDVSLKDRIKILINKTNSINLKGIDCLAYLLYLKGKLFRNEYRNKLNIVLIRDNTGDKPTARAILQINAIDENGEEYIEYYSYLPNQPLVHITKDKLQSMFDNNELAYIKPNEKNTIKGIRVR